jgi:phage shock protein PspC (stress-responsive transcriptional regulator)
METQLLTKYIIDRLSAAANRDDIIRYVCQRGNMNWVQAKAFVADVEETYALEIDRRHLPINLTSAIMVGLFGALVTVYAVLSIFEPLLGRPLPNMLYFLNDFGIHYGLLPDTHTALENLHRFGLLPDFWRTLYTLGQSFGVGHDLINILYVLAGGYFFWPLLLLGLCSLIAGSLEFFRNLFRVIKR